MSKGRAFIDGFAQAARGPTKTQRGSVMLAPSTTVGYAATRPSDQRLKLLRLRAKWAANPKLWRRAIVRLAAIGLSITYRWAPSPGD